MDDTERIEVLDQAEGEESRGGNDSIVVDSERRTLNRIVEPDAPAGIMRGVRTENMADMFDRTSFLDDGFLPDLELPAAALPTPDPLPPTLRIPAFHPMPLSERAISSIFTSPRLIPGTPRTRFALDPTSPSIMATVHHPLRPILSTPVITQPIELDVTDHYQSRVPASPMFAAQHHHPERPTTSTAPEEEQRTPHPLYTPVIPRRERRRQASRASKSVASGRTNKSIRSARSFVKSAWRTVRRRRRKMMEIHHTSTGAPSTTGSSSSSSSSSSNSTWNGWKFWKNSSAGSNTSSEGSSSDSEDEWEPPTPHFTLLTPCLARASNSAYPIHLLHGDHSTTPSKSSPIFDLVTSTTITPTLERLQSFWSERMQKDGVSGDIGAAGSSATAESRTDLPPQDDVAAATAAAATILKGMGVGGVKKGEARAARAEERRGTKNGQTVNPPAWWLDVMCPTVSDMRELRKLLPLHPLTMEDILQQETREKIETFPTLGYYFIVFRALDETYYKYTSPVTAPANVENLATAAQGGESAREKEDGYVEGRRGRARVDIVEGVGGKEGVEGVGVGAVNLYLVVFADGILSFHFEDVSKHVERVQHRIQQFGLIRVMSADWIAYNLMDSVVDTFFPLIDFIEQESNEVDNFLLNPFGKNNQLRTPIDRSTSASSSPTISAQRAHKEEHSVGIVIAPRKGGSEKLSDSFDSIDTFNKSTSTRPSTPVQRVLRLFSLPPLPTYLRTRLPQAWIRSKTVVESTMLVDASGFILSPRPLIPVPMTATVAAPKIDRAKMLRTIAETRKLITGLSRMLTPKTEVLRGLRKRTKDEGLLGAARSGDSLIDIETYLGDLSDHISAMQQTLVFYDAVLAHNHPAFIGVLRISLLQAKHGTDVSIIKLYIIALTILPMNVLIGLFSLNVNQPTEGTRLYHLDDDGNPAGFSLFYIILGGVFVIALLTWLFVYLMFKLTHRQMKKQRALR